MDPRVVHSKLESLRRCVRRIETKRPASLSTLQADLDLQDILSLNLTRAVQVSIDLAAHLVSDLDVPPPTTMADTFQALADADVLPTEVASRMKAAVGFRNVAVHAYASINWAIVHRISHDHLEDFRAFAQAIALATESES